MKCMANIQHKSFIMTIYLEKVAIVLFKVMFFSDFARGWDSRNNRERVELLICCVNRKTTWSAWSLYLPNDYKIIFPAKTMLAQFHNDGDFPPAFAFENQSDPRKEESGGYWIEVDEYVGGDNTQVVFLLTQHISSSTLSLLFLESQPHPFPSLTSNLNDCLPNRTG